MDFCQGALTCPKERGKNVENQTRMRLEKHHAFTYPKNVASDRMHRLVVDQVVSSKTGAVDDDVKVVGNVLEALQFLRHHNSSIWAKCLHQVRHKPRSFACEGDESVNLPDGKKNLNESLLTLELNGKILYLRTSSEVDWKTPPGLRQVSQNRRQNHSRLEVLLSPYPKLARKGVGKHPTFHRLANAIVSPNISKCP